MVEIGSVIRATVNRIEPYGIFLAHGPETVLVHLPEVAWADERPLAERVRPGEAYDVLVLRYNYQARQIVGSIRRLHPEQNPYRELARLEPGTTLRGRVVLDAGGALTVELPNGARGHLPKGTGLANVQRGDEVDVVISAVEVDDGRLTLGPAGLPCIDPHGAAVPMPSGQKA